MILGLGTDVCAVDRMENALRNPRFLRRWFTETEQRYLAGRRPESAAGIFAAKEAAAKALGTGFSGFGPASLEIDHDENGRPVCCPLDGAAERLAALGGREILVSISHDAGLAMAVAIVVD